MKFALQIFLLIGAFSHLLAGEPSSPARTEDASDHNRKLDQILGSIEALAGKVDQLERDLRARCGCRRDRPAALALQNDSVSQDQKEPLGQPLRAASSKDLFSFNKLAANLNTIQTDQLNWQPHQSDRTDDDSLSSWLLANTGDGSQASATPNWHNEFQMSLGQKYESMFGLALDNLSAVTREQLAGFRLTLNKLMNRFLDQTYQYNAIGNQLALIREECSLATDLIREHKSDARPPTAEIRPLEVPSPATFMPTLRSSDITMIVRLLSSELGELARGQPSGQNESALRGIEETLARERGQLEEMSSVVKQSAWLLAKLVEQQTRAPRNETSYAELTFNATSSDDGQTERPRSSTRWFAGSKTPGRNRTEAQGSPPPRPTPSARPAQCQSKTSLVTPASCSQLRLAGANCSGQYYVFVRGAIRHVYCDMNMDADDEGGGWTVILRRIDKTPESAAAPAQPSSLVEAIRRSQLDFRLHWPIYRLGFGQLSEWAEFFVGLELLHQLTSGGESAAALGANQTEMQLDLSMSDGAELHLRFDEFRVGNEQSRYRLALGGCNATERWCAPLLRLDGAEFATADSRPANCGASGATGGWWLAAGECAPEFSLTQPLGREPSGETRRMRWPGDTSARWVRQLVAKIRRKRTAGAGLWSAV